ncbi:MAG: 4a-hydroxytetrahydrobiopterin dehydratase [Rhizobacter sp.]|nr:4a-hydroxytetrahydrobiopterin dehydratase [Bacteriovorax sp.]
MNIQEINEKLKSLPEWTYQSETKSLVKTFNFKSYTKNISFVNAIAWIANKMNHHPDLEVSFNKCIVKITTHDEGGLSEKDFELAAKIENL